MMPTETRRQHEAADRLARDLSAAQIAANRYETDVNNQLQRDLQAGLISHQAAMQASQEAHEKALQANELAYNYAELAWTKEYGTQNLQILRDRLAWDQEYGRGQLALDERRVGVAEGGLQLDKDKFGLEKAIQEAMLKANPMNAVANSLYMRGQQPQGGMDQFGAPNTTLDNSGVLPFLQQLQGGGITSRATGAGLGNSIGGNSAPMNGAISQASFGNMSDTERGITTSLAAYNGMNPQDYWSNMQSTWNTNGQRGMNFSTRLG
jgi:surface antigen